MTTTIRGRALTLTIDTLRTELQGCTSYAAYRCVRVSLDAAEARMHAAELSLRTVHYTAAPCSAALDGVL